MKQVSHLPALIICLVSFISLLSGSHSAADRLVISKLAAQLYRQDSLSSANALWLEFNRTFDRVSGTANDAVAA